jgi:hypothetical protein
MQGFVHLFRGDCHATKGVLLAVRQETLALGSYSFLSIRHADFSAYVQVFGVISPRLVFAMIAFLGKN